MVEEVIEEVESECWWCCCWGWGWSCGGLCERMQGEGVDWSSSSLSVSSCLKLEILRIRRGDSLSFVLAWEKPISSIEECDEVLGSCCSC